MVHSDDAREQEKARTRDDAGVTQRTGVLVSVDAPGFEAPVNVTVEAAIAAWLHAKHGRSGSVETRAAYARTIHEFRTLLRERGLDLDTADPRRVRADMAHRAYRPTDASEVAAGGDVTHMQEPAVDGAAGAATAPADEDVENFTATRVSAMAVLAQAYAARPGRHGGRRPRVGAVSSRGGSLDGETVEPTDSVAQRTGSRLGPARAAAPATVNRRLAILSSFFTYALAHGLLRGVNPIARVERRHVESYAGAEPLDYDVLDNRLGAIDRTTPAGMRDYALLLLGLHTGRRLAELADMRREHVTIRRGGRSHVDLVWPRIKGGKRAHVRLPLHGTHGAAAQALVAWINALYGEDGRHDPLLTPSLLPTIVQQSTDTSVGSTHASIHPEAQPARPLWISLARNGTFGHPLSPSAIADICAARLGTSKVHALRHTYARGLEDAGAKVSQIQAYLGHADLSTTGRYLSRLTPEENPYLGRLADLFLTHRAPAVSTDMDAAQRPTGLDAPTSAVTGAGSTETPDETSEPIDSSTGRLDL